MNKRLLFLLTTSCSAAYAPTDTDYVFHAAFELGVAHADASCDACHVLAAYDQRVRQGLDVPPPTDGEFVVGVLGACHNCHPFVAELGEVPVEDDCQVGSPIIEHEYCRYVGFHRVNRPEPCTGGTCHAVEHQDWLMNTPAE